MTMEKLSEKEWKAVKLGGIADISSGRDIYAQERIDGDTPYITSGTANNGIGYFVANDNDSKTKNAISVNRNGAVGEAFYHPYQALYGNDCRRVNMKDVDDADTQLFTAECISKQKKAFSYSRKLGTARLKRLHVMLPVTDSGKPDYEYMAEYTKQTREKLLSRYREYVEKRIAELGEEVEIPALSEKEWKAFSVSDLFSIQLARGDNQLASAECGQTPLVSAGTKSNGVIGFITNGDDGSRLRAIT